MAEITLHELTAYQQTPDAVGKSPLEQIDAAQALKDLLEAALAPVETGPDWLTQVENLVAERAEFVTLGDHVRVAEYDQLIADAEQQLGA